MTPEQEQQYRKLANELVARFGEPLMDALLQGLGKYVRLLNTAADGIWLAMAHEIRKFPKETLLYLKKFSGANRMKKLILLVAPDFIKSAPIEKVEEVVNELFPILDELNLIRHQMSLQLEEGGNNSGQTKS